MSSQWIDVGLPCLSPPHSSTALAEASRESKEKKLNGKKHSQQATGCTWPREGWLVGSRKWREKKRKERFWIAAAFQLKRKKTCFEARRDILLFFPRTIKRRKSSFSPQRALSAVVVVTVVLSAFQLLPTFIFSWVPRSWRMIIDHWNKWSL